MTRGRRSERTTRDVSSGNNNCSDDSNGDSNGDADSGDGDKNSNSGGGDSDSGRKNNNQLKPAAEEAVMVVNAALASILLAS
jgi:hypothetical protein